MQLLVRKHLISRTVEPANRREIATIIGRAPATQRARSVEASTAFRNAAGEEPVLDAVPW